MPDYGVGYFYSINARNRDAFSAIGKSIRAYVTYSVALLIATAYLAYWRIIGLRTWVQTMGQSEEC